MTNMWDGFFARRNFYNKCKSAMRMITMRMEIITKKRNAMQNFLKKDVADLLRSNLDLNAYGRAHGLYMELNLSWCYNYVQECCNLISDKLKDMQTEMECPEDCRVAVASLSYAAARFADLPELRDLRSLFTDKYGNALEPFVNKEFIEKVKSSPPTREQKLRLMKEIAEEYSIPWNPASFDQNNQQVQTPRVYKDNGMARNESRGRERVVYERTASSNEIGNKEVEPRRAFTNNVVVPAPYVKMKNSNAGDESDEESLRERLLRHYSMKSRGNDRSESSCGSSGGTYGRSVSMYANHTHPKLPNCDELASRIQALRKM